MGTSLVVDLLAQRPEAELRAKREEAELTVQRLQVEIQQLDEALARVARRAGRTAQGGLKTDTRRRVLQIVGDHGGPVSPAEVIEQLHAQDLPTPKNGAIHNMIGRLARDGVLARVGDGLYDLPGRNGANGAASGLSEIDAHEPPSTATARHEGAATEF
jgi:hypothetical protein